MNWCAARSAGVEIGSFLKKSSGLVSTSMEFRRNGKLLRGRVGLFQGLDRTHLRNEWVAVDVDNCDILRESSVRTEMVITLKRV